MLNVFWWQSGSGVYRVDHNVGFTLFQLEDKVIIRSFPFSIFFKVKLDALERQIVQSMLHLYPDKL